MQPATRPTAAEKRRRLAARVRSRELTVAPGVFEMISATIADSTGFDALYMTGYGVSASHLGLPDAGLTSYTDMASRAATIAAATSAPLIADADTGFGDLLNVHHTVQGYEAAGVAAIQIEDQEFPKKCGHAAGRTVVPTADMVKKIEVALEARTDDDLLVIARTDARTSLGLDEAIARGQAFAAAGADVVFVESPETDAEFAAIADEIDAPLLANMVEGGFSPTLSADQLRELGFAIAIWPTTGFLTMAAGLRRAYGHLREQGRSAGVGDTMLPLDEMHELMGFDAVWAFDDRWAD